MSYANHEVLPTLAGWFRPLVGRDPYNKKNVEDSMKAALKAVGAIEQHLLINTFLVGERITLADIFAVGILARGFQYFFDKTWRSANPNVTRWYETVYSQPIYSAVVDKLSFIDEAIKNTPPASAKKEASTKKEKEPAAKKEAPKPKAKEVEDEEEEGVQAPKPKHPLEALPKATLVLDDWKRKYSNEETREVALPWFWENYKPDEYSLWKVDYKYNDELTQVFMSSNLIGKSPSLTSVVLRIRNDYIFDFIASHSVGGFFARLEGSRKYIFGAASVYGQANDSVIQGAFVIRGQEASPAFDVAPDFESYEFTKLDPSKAEDKEFVENQWSWDKPVEVKGKTYNHADGKVFK